MPEDTLVNEDAEALALTSAPSSSLSRFPLLVAVGVLELPKSRDVPGVLGVFAVDPKDAKAPEPSPKAEDAPVVGVDAPVVVKGDMPFSGFALPPVVPSVPKRFAAEYVRVESGLVLSLPLVFGLEVDRESLLELCREHAVSDSIAKLATAYFERLCQRLSMN